MGRGHVYREWYKLSEQMILTNVLYTSYTLIA